MDQVRFEDLPALIVKLCEKIDKLEATVSEKLTTPDGYEPDVTMSVDELSEYLKITPDNIYKKVRAGSLPHHRSGRIIFFKKKEIDQATKVNNHKRKFFKQ